jgi:L-cysteine/cystine lyase
VTELAALARAAGAITIVDGAQAAGAIPMTLDDLGVDAYAVPAQKWLLGPEGMGALWLRREVAASLASPVGGFTSFDALDLAGNAVPRPDARRFEATTFHRPSVVGMARSCGWLTMYVGLHWALERAAALAAFAADRLAAIPGVTLLTPRGRMATIVTFRVAGWPSATVVEELGARVFAIVRDIPGLDGVRLSVGFWNTEDELERLARTVELLAAHTPGTVPARRGLAILGGDGRPLG